MNNAKALCCRCSFVAYDFCARCGAAHCEECTRAGCCGVAPAESGVEQEHANQLDAVQSAYYDNLLPRRTA
jgi:hypothetical protein